MNVIMHPQFLERLVQAHTPRRRRYHLEMALALQVINHKSPSHL